MSVVNRRNAVVGYLVLLVFKRALWRRAKRAVEHDERRMGRMGRPLTGAAVLVGLSAVGAAVAWRLRAGRDGVEELP
jgi:hypothetical protein